jgi:hypothetical protein
LFFSTSACKEIVVKEVEMIPSEHPHTFDAGLRLPARDAGFVAALEAGFAFVSAAAALEAGFAAALDGGLAAGLEAGLVAA